MVMDKLHLLEKGANKEGKKTAEGEMAYLVVKNS